MIDVNVISKALKIDKAKAFEALPSVAVILEKSELIDLIVSFKGKIGQAEGFKIVTRIVSRMKLYQDEIDEVLSIMFNIPVGELDNAQKMELIQKILVEKDLDEFF